MASNPNGNSKLGFAAAVFLALAATASASASAAVSVYLWKRRKSRELESRIRELEASLRSSSEKCAAERRGRIGAQQALRKAIAQPRLENSEVTSYPMRPIGIVKSCFSTRNGTPRQPLIVPLARASLVFDASLVPPASLEGLEGYSHCWIIYVFHLNTDLEKLWKETSRSKFKAKVRVPRLKGEKVGVFATRSPHRPCPIGLTVAKVEAIKGNTVLLSGVDLVDGTPVLDIKPYLSYCDSLPGARVPSWVMVDSSLAVASVNFSGHFSSTLADCWAVAGKSSMYASPEELQKLIEEVLSWDIRSVSQRNRSHDLPVGEINGKASDMTSDLDNLHEDGSDGHEKAPLHPTDIVYHLVLERFDISYSIDPDGNVFVEKVSLPSDIPDNNNENIANQYEE
ncbi:tRNA (adenine(37)-N6)-methyltransferase [Eucalyptus grandis]|uniref:tRNA (adenine(37)-N6)-methyltransferase n=1 Tax=Eucalyptus grandis TaxID=71139 RepID=UPI00192E7648|nr:tRNA (adenine(37)-N6)-methyltransferase [Eucalyptus grandis]